MNLSKIYSKILLFNKKIENLYDTKGLLFIFAISAIVIIWQWPLLISGDSLLSGDFDYFTQAYEAIRISILNYHQFPWINAWIGGGVPLYANPQVGVFSIQTLFVMVFGTPVGLKLSIVAYSLIGYWGMFCLLRQNIRSRLVPALALSGIWVMNGFFVAHLVSHYSFAMFLVFPLLLFLLLNIRRKYYWIFLGLCLALFILSAFHYAAFHGFLILGIVGIAEIIRHRSNILEYLLLYIKTGAIFLILAGHRIFYTVQYAFDFPRMFKDEPNSIFTVLKSFVVPLEYRNTIYGILQPGKTSYGWLEYTAFVGYFISLLIVASIVIGFYYLFNKFIEDKTTAIAKLRKSSNVKIPLVLAGLLILCILIGIGDFSSFSPYAILGKLPAFSGMRVPSRWLIWAVFVGLLFLSSIESLLKDNKIKVVFVLFILLGTAEVYVAGFGNDHFSYKPVVFRNSYSEFEQFEDFDRKNIPYDFNKYKPRSTYDRRAEIYSYEATLNNLGQSRGYEPITDTYYAPTARCGVVQGCSFIKSGNAEVAFWSPNKIILNRTDSGPIELNMNPSNYWLANGVRIFQHERTAEVLKYFIIYDNANTIELVAQPRTITELLHSKITEY